MAIEAEILSVSTPGSTVVVVVAYALPWGVEKESISFSEDDLTPGLIRQRVREIGQRKIARADGEAIARAVVGEKITINKAVPPPPVS